MRRTTIRKIFRAGKNFFDAHSTRECNVLSHVCPSVDGGGGSGGGGQGGGGLYHMITMQEV